MTTAAHLVTSPTGRDERATADRTAATGASVRPSWRVAWQVLSSAAMICWVIAAFGLKSLHTADYGLLAASPLLAVSIGLTVLAFLCAVRAGSWAGVVVSVACLIVVERVTVTVGTDVPLYPWTYKHLAVISYVQRYGGVTRGLDIYNQWPGLFSATAWLSNLTGVAPTTIAHWFTPAVHVLGALAVYALARSWRAGPLSAASATFVWEALSFIAQDYFSPQALAYLLGIGVLICLGLARTHRSFAYLSLLPFAAVTITHQLSPYWLLLVAFGLLVFRQLRPWWVPVIMAVVAGGYLYWNYAAVQHYGGAVSGSVKSNVLPSAQASDVFPATLSFRLTELVYAVVFLGAAICFLVAWRRKRSSLPAGVKESFLPAGVLTFAPVLLLAAQSYGGEAIFRVFLFALPGAALLLAPQLNRLLQAKIPVLTIGVALLVITSAAAAQQYFSGWFAYRVTAGEVAANDYFAQTVNGPSYFTSVPPGWPSIRSWQYAYLSTQQPDYGASIFAADNRIKVDLADPAAYAKVMTSLADRKKLPTYLMVSERVQYYGWFTGTLPKNGVDEFLTQVSADPRWQLAFTSGDARVYRLVS